MKSFIVIILLITVQLVRAQPGPQWINLNINNVTENLLEQYRSSSYSLTIIIDSNYDSAKFTCLRQLSEIKLDIKINKLPDSVSNLSGSLYKLQVGSSNGKLRDLSSLKKLNHLNSLTIVGNFDPNSLVQETTESLLLIYYPNPDLPALRHLLNLRSLEILDSNVSNLRNLSYLKSLSILKLRNLDSLKKLDWDGGNTLLSVIEVNNCPNLQSVAALSTCKNVNFIGLSQLYTLRKLDFDMTRMAVKRINIGYCGLKDISAIASSKSLKSLNILPIESLSKIDFDMSRMNLDSLSISGDGYYGSSIKDISGVFSCHSLGYLKISDLDSLEMFDMAEEKMKLRDLIVDNCKMLKTIKGLSGCRSLVVLYLTENAKLEKIPNLTDLTFVKEIWIQRNPLLKIPKRWNSFRISENGSN